MRPPRPTRPQLAGLLAAGLAAGLLAAGCSTAEPETSSGGAQPGSRTERYDVAFVTAAVGLTGYQVMRCEATEAARKYRLDLTWQGSNSTSVSEEMNVLQSVLARKPDGLLLVPWDSSAFVGPVRALREAGTPVVTADGSLDKPVDVANVRTDNLTAGRAAARDLGRRLDGRGSVGILTDAPANVVQNQRWQGFRDTLRREYPDIEVLAPQYVGADLSKATSTAASLLTRNRDLGAIYSTQDVGVNGAASAIKAAGRRGQVRNIGWDATRQTVRLLEKGDLDGIVSQNFVEEGRMMMAAINKALREPDAKQPHDQYPPTKYLTRDNVDDPSSRDYIYVPRC